MRIRVAYDILFLANFFKHPGGKSGVYRTVESLLFELCKREDIELTTVAVCGEDPLVDVSNASRYVSGSKEISSCRFDPALAGRFGLSKLYLQSFGDSSPGEQKAQPFITRVVRRTDRPRAALERDRYDVFHSPFYKLPVTDIVGVPRIQTVFDLICQRHPEWMPDSVVTLAHDIFRSIDLERDWVTCISEFTKQEFCEFTGMAAERVFVTPLAAAKHFRPVEDTNAILAARLKYAIPDGPYFLALGALQPRKNFIHLIRCFVRLVSEQPQADVNLIIVGASAWMYEEIFSTIEASHQARKRIVFTGFVSDEDLSAVYSGARAFVFPSLYEGFGLPLLEAMQCGTPVVAANTTALPEVVGDAGLLVEPADEDALCQAMLEFLTNDELRAQLSKKGLERAKQFSWAQCAEKSVAAYRVAAGAG